MVGPQDSKDKIKVFISYSHKDESHRDELEKQLKVLERSDLISAWDDRDIDAGEEWRTKIDANLESAQIILLLISANFMASDYCHDIEMQRAMQKHDSGEARVIPILLSHVDWKDSPFAKIQMLPSNSRPITSEKWVNTDAAFYDVEQGIKRVIEKIRSGRLKIGSEPFSVIVDQMERDGFSTITEALNNATPGAKILVRAGVYDEDIIIDKPLEITGDGVLGDVIIRADNSDAILFNAVRGRISNLMLKQSNPDKFGLNIIKGNLDVEDCDISSDDSSCIAIHSGAFPKILNNKIHGSNKSGIFIFDNGQGVINGNNIYGNALSGISIEDHSNPTVINNTIHDNRCGISIVGNSRGLINSNKISNNAGLGIMVLSASKPNIINNEINRNRKSGLCISESEALIQGNDILDNVESGIIIHLSDPTVSRNHIHHNNKSASALDDDEPIHEEQEPTLDGQAELLNLSSNPQEDDVPYSSDLIDEGSTEKTKPTDEDRHFDGLSALNAYSESLGLRGKSLTECMKDLKNSIFPGAIKLSRDELIISDVQSKINSDESELSIYGSELIIYPPEPKLSHAGVLIFSGNPVICQNFIKGNNGYGIFIQNGEGAIEDNDLSGNELGPCFESRLSKFKLMRNKGLVQNKK